MRRKRFYVLLAIIICALAIPSFSQITHKNQGKSVSIGEVNKGAIENAYQLPRKGKNFKYFSLFSYYVLGRAYVNSAVYHAVLESYSELYKSHPEKYFRIMECSRKHGGSMRPHRTHQNGLSVDFSTPLIKNGKQTTFYNKVGIFHYALNFNNKGQLKINRKVSVDFDLMAEHILLLDIAARKHGYKISKVIFKLELKDALFATENGKKLKAKGIYFAQRLTPVINKLHDEHYHVDFEKIK